MAKEFFLKFATARYWVSATEAEKHAQKEFETRNEAKDWLVERGRDARGCGGLLAQADGGRAVRVFLKNQ
jgi:hypothetical protein